jgi:dienelactone hydrolase
LNPYALRRKHLKLVRLPISPPPHSGQLVKYSKVSGCEERHPSHCYRFNRNRVPICAFARRRRRRCNNFVVKTLQRSLALGVSILLLVAARARAQGYREREIVIPWVQAGHGLDALLVYVDLPGKHPLVVMTHGSARKVEDHARVSPWAQLPQALWFARRGWVVLVVVRRGYGASGGEPDGKYAGRCPETSYQAAGEYAADDLRRAIDYARELPEVDATRILVTGVSTGGFATVALTENPPPGVVAAINFAGGRGSKADHDVCNPDDLIGAYRNFGKHSRTPMLWLYAQNDKFFWPELAQKFDAAFRSQGGQEQFVLAPPIGQDGHSLFRHPEAWSDTVDAFLKAQNLVPLPALLPEVAAPNVPAPTGLSEDGLDAFHSYLLLGPHKAFAVSEHSYGYSVANRSQDDARKKAFDNCKHSAKNHEACKVVNLDNTQVNQ